VPDFVAAHGGATELIEVAVPTPGSSDAPAAGSVRELEEIVTLTVVVAVVAVVTLTVVVAVFAVVVVAVAVVLVVVAGVAVVVAAVVVDGGGGVVAAVLKCQTTINCV
jgi:hypothetical protein